MHNENDLVVCLVDINWHVGQHINDFNGFH